MVPPSGLDAGSAAKLDPGDAGGGKVGPREATLDLQGQHTGFQEVKTVPF